MTIYAILLIAVYGFLYCLFGANKVHREGADE